jgi:hypothetical protein
MAACQLLSYLDVSLHFSAEKGQGCLFVILVSMYETAGWCHNPKIAGCTLTAAPFLSNGENYFKKFHHSESEYVKHNPYLNEANLNITAVHKNSLCR